MRSPIALPAAFVVIVLGCGRDPRGAGAPEADPRAAPSLGASAPTPSTDPRTAGDRGSVSATATTAPTATGSSAPPPPPIDGKLPPTDTLALSTKAGCPAKTCRLEGSLLEALLGSPENRAPAAIWEEDLGAGAAVTFARRSDLDVLGVTLTGDITLTADEQKATATELTAWHAFVAPGGGIALHAKGGPARVVLVVVTAGDPVATKGAATKASPWTARPAPIASVDLASAPDLAWGKGAYHARIGLAADASPRASLGTLKMSRDGVVSPHEHANEWEHMAILQGEGDFVQGTGESERTLHATSGVIFSVPPATRHTWRSAGSKEFVGIQLYTPPGPEQRFKKLAAPP
jgi:mannose-6-phosphate isomerase-like protein (cupin superfamily)